MDLLKGEPELLRKGALADVESPSANPDAGPDMRVNRGGLRLHGAAGVLIVQLRNPALAGASRPATLPRAAGAATCWRLQPTTPTYGLASAAASAGTALFVCPQASALSLFNAQQIVRTSTRVLARLSLQIGTHGSLTMAEVSTELVQWCREECERMTDQVAGMESGKFKFVNGGIDETAARLAQMRKVLASLNRLIPPHSPAEAKSGQP